MSNYGGKRPNSGRKPHPMGETVVKRVPKGLIPIVDTLIKTHQKPFNGVIKTLACMPLDAQHIDPKADVIQIPLTLGYIPAGFASPAEGYAEDYIDLNEYLVRNRSATIIMRWDIKQLRDEQTLLQPIHEKYLSDANLFRWFSNQMTDSENRKYTGKLIKEEQTQSGGIDILDKSSGIRYGCKLLGYT